MKNPYNKTEKESYIELLVLEYIPLVKKIAHKMSARIAGAVSVEELVQVGVIGLIEVARRFDEKRDNQFKTYAEFRIRGAMLDDLRERDWIPRSVRESATKLERALSELRNQGHDSPPDDLICEKLGIKPDEFNDFMTKAKPMMLFSFEDFGKNNSTGEQMDFTELISNPDEVTPEKNLFKGINKEVLAKAIQLLSEKEQTVLALYYQEDMNLKEISKIMEITESRVSQIRTKAIAGLRGLLKDSQID